jgi:hypothetical protein
MATIEIMRRKHLEAVVAIDKEAQAIHDIDFGPLPSAWSWGEKQFVQAIEGRAICHVLLSREGEVLGYTLHKSDKDKVVLLRFGVREDVRDTRAAHDLLDFIVERAHPRAFECVLPETDLHALNAVKEYGKSSPNGPFLSRLVHSYYGQIDGIRFSRPASPSTSTP